MSSQGENGGKDEDAGASELARDVWLDFVQGHPASDDAAFDELCRRRPELRSDLRRLRSAAHAPSPEASAEAFAERLRELAELLPVERRLRPEGVLARGGMGVIHVVRDLRLDRSLALKQMASGPAERHALAAARFYEEAQITSQLDHPGIVPVHECGVDAEGRLYFAMKLVHGRDLREILELARAGTGGWSLTRTLGVLLKLCEAMAYAHSKGVIHRDLKPSNVMVGHFGEVYVMDWGLARAVGRKDVHDVRVQPEHFTRSVHTDRREEREETPDSPLVTMDGVVLGTPAYMPPEQARGDIHQLSARSDVYSLGAMLYHLLVGHAPFVAPDVKVSARSVLWRVIEGPPPPLQSVAPGAPAELVAVCEKAMARDPARRYPDMGALAEDLRAFLEHRVVSAYRTGALAELRKWVRRNRALAVASGVALLALVAGLAAALVLKAESDRNARLAHERELAAEREVRRLSAFQVLAELQAEADELWPAAPARVPAYERWLERAHALVAELEPSTDGSYRGHLAELEDVRTRARPSTEDERELDARSHPRFAELQAKRARLAELRRVAALRSAPGSPSGPSLPPDGVPPTVAGLCGLAWPLVDPGRAAAGGEARGLALANLALERAQDELEGARASEVLAWAFFANGRDGDALAEMENAVAIAPADRTERLARARARLRFESAERERALAPAAMQALAEEVTALEHEVSADTLLRFDQEDDRWWFLQLTRLVADIRALADPETGTIDGLSPEHGWGIARRMAFAETMAERSLYGPEAARAWREAIDSIADEAECPLYGGLSVEPQLGLLPIGRDPRSGLWEFAHLMSGEPARRGPDGELEPTEASGIVLVLLPGGWFRMGAQATNPKGPNHDPWAAPYEGPVHEVLLSPYFVSKYEMTQAQWLRLSGENPSLDVPATYMPYHNAAGRPGSLLHPVEQVDWWECRELLARADLTLPTEAQWEFAARGGMSTRWWTGDDVASLAGAANVLDRYAAEHGGDRWTGHELSLDDGNTSHAPVGSYPANPFGLHDVIGNVAEWCRDGLDPNAYTRGPRTDPCADPVEFPLRFTRGGSFGLPFRDTRVSIRTQGPPETAELFTGVRPARALDRGHP